MKFTLKAIKYNSLYNDLVAGKPFLSDFLHPVGNIDWTSHAGHLLPGTEIHQRVKRILRDQNSDQKTENALKYINQLDDPESMIIITGQQLGLFVSPLYTIYKALTVVKLVEKLNRDHSGKLSFVPVFWLESEDHDFQEVNHIGLWDNAMTPVKAAYGGTDHEKMSLRYYILEEQIRELISGVEELLVPTEFRDKIIGSLRANYRAGSNWLECSRSFFRELLEDTGILFFEPGADAVKDLAQSFFSSFLTRTEEVNDIFSKDSKKIAEHGYDLQVPPMPGKTWVHIEDEQRQRSHIYYKNDGYQLYADQRTIDKKAMQELVNSNPRALSTAVISRPVLQSWLLPVAAYVAGPAEIAYWAQMSGLFKAFDLYKPVVYPRISLTLVEPKVKRFAGKHQVDLIEIPMKKQGFLDSFFTQSPGSGDDPFPEFKSTLQSQVNNLIAYLKNLDPTLVPAAEKMIERVLGQVENLEHKTILARQRQDQTITSQLEQIHHSLFPEGIPQERFASIIYFINKFGPDILKVIEQKMEIGNFQHQVIFPGGN